MKKGDFVVFLCLGLVLLCSLSVFFFPSNSGNTVIIEQDNKTLYKYSIYQNRTVRLDNNTVVIENGEVFVKSASCKNQICVNHKPISKKGECIICLPNKVYIEVN